MGSLDVSPDLIRDPKLQEFDNCLTILAENLKIKTGTEYMSRPSKCPKCGQTWGRRVFGVNVASSRGYSKVGEDKYQCKECGYIVDLETDRPHVSHEEFDG